MVRKTLLTFAALVFGSTIALAEVNPEGIWRLTSGRVTVKVVRCGNNICANIVGLSSPNYPDGTPLLDAMNPNKALRKRPVMGLPVISGMVQSGPNTYKGYIYNADDGGSYRATAYLTDKTMKLKGCWLVFCRDSDFVRIK
ncbi:MAG: DUF2147 domain-containing protein [Alphaproteobacteria bacterium]|nr:DUF2147 domain-containing protein [Alphaproteobacteria bacterium]